MAIDAATRESLELTATAAGQRKGSLLDAVDRTVTGAGARLLGGDIGAPLMDRAAVEARLDLVGYLHDDPGLREQLRAHLRALPDIGRALGRLAAGRGGPRDLAQLRDGLDGAWLLGERLGELAAAPPLPRRSRAATSRARCAGRSSEACAGAFPADRGGGRRLYRGRLRPRARRSARYRCGRQAGDRRAGGAVPRRNRDRDAEDPPQRRARLSCRGRPHAPCRSADGARTAGFTHRQTLAGVVRFNAPALHEVWRSKVSQAGNHALAAEAGASGGADRQARSATRESDRRRPPMRTARLDVSQRGNGRACDRGAAGARPDIVPIMPASRWRAAAIQWWRRQSRHRVSASSPMIACLSEDVASVAGHRA